MTRNLPLFNTFRLLSFFAGHSHSFSNSFSNVCTSVSLFRLSVASPNPALKATNSRWKACKASKIVTSAIVAVGAIACWNGQNCVQLDSRHRMATKATSNTQTIVVACLVQPSKVHNRSFLIFCSLAAPIPAGGKQNHWRLDDGRASKKMRVAVNINKGGVDSAGTIPRSSAVGAASFPQLNATPGTRNRQMLPETRRRGTGLPISINSSQRGQKVSDQRTSGCFNYTMTAYCSGSCCIYIYISPLLLSGLHAIYLSD